MSDDEARRRLVQLFAPIQAWTGRLDAPIDTEPGSSLAADTLPNSGLWPITHLVDGSVMSAVDHLRCFAESLGTAQGIYIVAYDSLLRGALLSAGNAVWVLGGRTRAQRRLRNLLIWRDDWRNQLRLAKSLRGTTAIPAALIEAEIEKLEGRLEVTSATLAELQEAVGPGSPGAYSTTGMVEDVASYVFTSNVAEGEILRAGVITAMSSMSGVAHGAPRAWSMRFDRDGQMTPSEGGSLVRVSVDLPTLYWTAAGVVLIANKAWHLYDARRVAV